MIYYFIDSRPFKDFFGVYTVDVHYLVFHDILQNGTAEYLRPFSFGRMCCPVIYRAHRLASFFSVDGVIFHVSDSHNESACITTLYIDVATSEFFIFPFSNTFSSLPHAMLSFVMF
jgi:hypothetical protein